MSNSQYNLLKQTLNLESAATWLIRDSRDDFFPDPFYFKEIAEYIDKFKTIWDHKLLQVDSLSWNYEWSIKGNKLLREAIWLHPVHRILYLSILHHLLPKIDSKLSHSVYSYRSDSQDSTDAYPFSKRMNRWKTFNNDFREAALNDSCGAVVITDLSCFFDHIDCEQLCIQICSLLGPSITSEDNAVVGLLKKLLLMWSGNNFGIPQNYDASSVFCSVYLHRIDQIMVQERRYQYFRWIDDIRIVAKNYRQALRAIHDLQKALISQRLFLATDKTDIITRDDNRFEDLVDVKDDEILSNAEEVIRSRDCTKFNHLIDQLFERLEIHSDKKTSDRKFRAYSNRLMEIGNFKEYRESIYTKLHQFVIPRLNKFPDRCDYWTKMLSVIPGDEIFTITRELLIDKPSIFDRQRFYLWKLAL